MTEIVEPTISDFEANPTSVRHAFLACVVTFHSIDYVPKKSANRRKLFRKESPEFATVDRIAHAFKHVETGPGALVGSIGMTPLRCRPEACLAGKMHITRNGFCYG
jgi:hypothetical protein